MKADSGFLRNPGIFGGVEPPVKFRFAKWGLRIFLRSQKNLAMVANRWISRLAEKHFAKAFVSDLTLRF